MLYAPDPPVTEPDAHVYQIPESPSPAECGAYGFGRLFATHLAILLNTPITLPLYRSNPFDRRRCPRVESYELTTAGHSVLVTVFDHRPPLSRGTLTVFGIHLDGRRIEFEPVGHGEMEWQLARTLWIAITDYEIAANRAKSQAQVEPVASADRSDRAVQVGAEVSR
jgi:hypothetical protein